MVAIPPTRPPTTASHAPTAGPATTKHSRRPTPTGGFTTIDASPRRVAGVSHPYGRNSPHAPDEQKAACNSGTRTFYSTQKRCNSNDMMSNLEIRAGELHATFLRNHNMRHLKGPQAEDNSSPEDAHPGRHLARIHATTTRQEAASTPLHKTRDLTSPPGVSKSSSTAAQPH